MASDPATAGTPGGAPGRTSRRPLARVPIPPGPAGVMMLMPHLQRALDGTGPAIAPVPVVSTTVSQAYVMSVLEAVRADDPPTPLESDEVAVVIATSGSTGAPRGVLLTASQLTALTGAINGAILGRATSDGEGTGDPQWIAALPVTSMGGLNVVVRALATGRPPLVLPSVGGAEPFTPAAFTSAVNVARSRTADVRVSLVPAQVARLLSDPAATEALAACRSVLVGGGPLRTSLRTMAVEVGVRLTTTYGATETAGGCVLDGRPLPGVTVHVDAPDPATPGILLIEGACVAMGYRADPELTASRFSDRRFRTSDLGTVSSDGEVMVLGRDDDVVVIKGINVSPGAVERVVEDLPDVQAAASVVVDGPAGEPVVIVFVQVRDLAPGIGTAVREAVGERLGAVARPHLVRRVDRLPHLPNGKVDRQLLAAWASTPPQD